MVFVIDEKTNGKNNNIHQKIWNFINDLIENINILGGNQVKIRFVKQCTEVPELKLGKLKNKSKILHAFDQIKVRHDSLFVFCVGNMTLHIIM